MKKNIFTLISFILFTSIFGFDLFDNLFTITTLQQIQTKPYDSLVLGRDKSNLNGSFVEIIARVVAPPRVSPLNNDFRTLLRGSSSWSCYAQDTSNELFGGIVIRQESRALQTGLDLVDTGMIIKVRGIVNEFGSTSSNNYSNTLTRILIDGYTITVLSNSNHRPSPIQVTIPKFIVGDYPNGGSINYVEGEKYEGMYVEIRNVIVGSGLGNRQPFSIIDGSGNKMYVRDFSNFFSISPSGDTLREFVKPSVGSIINSIKGVIINSNNEGAFGSNLPYVIVPIYPNDMTLRDNSPPQLIYPPNNSLSNPLSINFNWENTSFLSTYTLQISTDLTFNTFVYNDTTLTDTFKTVNGLIKDTKYYWRVGAKDSIGITYYSSTWNFKTYAPLKVNLEVLIEGLYNPFFNQLIRKDTVSLYLRDNVSPYILRDSLRNIIDSVSTSGMFFFPNANTGSYYIVAKHFNSIETWSKFGGDSLVNDGSIYEYDFTNSNSQAYGNNLKLIGGRYCIYSGDVDQNGYITLSDILYIYNKSQIFETGSFLTSDLNGDSIVDLADINLCYNNSINFISILNP